ncbi:MAG: nicotinate (nicotinamide) nucleotide adenylyltransferase [Vulcanimicrobiaceae bacterium]
MRLGLFGGAFDPVHNAHLFVAEAVRTRESLDRVIFLPIRAAHHREAPRASIDDRATMLRLAIAANPAFMLDLSDAQEDATGYTADLLPRLRQKFPEDELFFIAGSDSLVRGGWRRFDEILELLHGFFVVPRNDLRREEVDNALIDIAPKLRAKVRFIDLPLAAESATSVRERLDAGQSVRYLVPEPVWRYMIDHKLYQHTGVASA